MSKIQVLDQITIDKIAAGEVIERPASIVKELVENSIDAEAASVVIEIKDGGISFIRITDNGCGIEKEDVPNAFLRHSTSKIRSAEDLLHIHSLGFRGEALSSIAAVSQVELITKPKGIACGITYRIEGGKEISMDETGAPDGTTFLIRQLFYNTPARRKFLKTAMTEASHVADLVSRIALSHPEISFRFINNGQVKIHTSGNGRLQDVIYHIYGREIAGHLLNVHAEYHGIKIEGYIGEPVISRGNRNFENYFINGRYVKSSIISKAVEDAYKDFSMQHRYPFTAFHLTITGDLLDVNVHPTKMEVRFGNQQEIYNFIYETIRKTLRSEELIPHIELPAPSNPPVSPAVSHNSVREQSVLYDGGLKKQSAIQNKQSALYNGNDITKSEVCEKQSAVGKKNLDYFMDRMRERVTAYHAASAKESPSSARIEETPVQLNLFEERLLDHKSVKEHKIIGQLFDTYWLVEFSGSLYIIDQHAAHERILYEKTLAGMKTRDYTSQNISPPIILELSMKESELLETYMDQFVRIGFSIENFGPDSYAVCAVPDNLFSIAKKDLLIEMLDSLSDELHTGMTSELIDEKIASMSCKAAVKGNMHMTAEEADAMIGELLNLENPYHCPHGRPTIISMTKRELEKKFKRIV